MFTVRCEKGTGEIHSIIQIARKYRAATQIEDDDPDNRWFSIAEYDEADETAIKEEIAQVTTAWEQW